MNLKVRLPAIYLRSDFTPRFSLALTRKDVADALARGWAERDASIVLTLREERADTVVHLPESCTCLKGRSRGLTQRTHVHRGCGAIHPGSTRQAVNEGRRAVALRLIPPLATAD
jgi:hypothetical protein